MNPGLDSANQPFTAQIADEGSNRQKGPSCPKRRPAGWHHSMNEERPTGSKNQQADHSTNNRRRIQRRPAREQSKGLEEYEVCVRRRQEKIVL